MPKTNPNQVLKTELNSIDGGPVKCAVSQSLDDLTAVSGVGSSPALATCETSQVLLADVPGVFLGVLPFSPHLLIGPSHMS